MGVAVRSLELDLEHLVGLGTLDLPLFEEAESKGSQDGTKLAVQTLLILVQHDVHFENFAQTLPELERSTQTAVEQCVLQLREVDDLELRLQVQLNLGSLGFNLLFREDPGDRRNKVSILFNRWA